MEDSSEAAYGISLEPFELELGLPRPPAPVIAQMRTPDADF
jgi:hypothetical protein